MTPVALPPTARYEASTSAARTRLPGLRSAYAKAAPAVPPTSPSSRVAQASRRASTPSRASVRIAWAARLGIKVRELELATGLLQHLLDPLLHGTELLARGAEALDPLFKEGDRLVEIDVLGFEGA